LRGAQRTEHPFRRATPAGLRLICCLTAYKEPGRGVLYVLGPDGAPTPVCAWPGIAGRRRTLGRAPPAAGPDHGRRRGRGLKKGAELDVARQWHTVVHCTTDGCRSAWYRPRHYPPDATPSDAAGEPGGEPPSPTQGDPEPTEAFDITAITSHPATGADTSRLAGSRSHRESRGGRCLSQACTQWRTAENYGATAEAGPRPLLSTRQAQRGWL
jgi:hypothetical protein